MPPHQQHQSEEEDRLSMLTDDLLLSILGRLDIRTAARTSVLSARWRHLPWLLPDLTIDVKDFLSVPCPDRIQLWMQPEMKQLCTSLNKLRKLRVRGIFVEFDILWTAAFLVAAPSVEILHIEACDHPCDWDEEGRVEHSFSTRMPPHWEMDFNNSKNLLLKELEFAGFRSLEQQFTFIRFMLERSPNLQKIVLKGDEQCDMCEALDVPSKFPKKDDHEMVVKRIRDGRFSPIVIFDE